VSHFKLGHTLRRIAIDESITDPDLHVQETKRPARQRLDRQRWLSRLPVATPRILAAEYARMRRRIEPPDGLAGQTTRARASMHAPNSQRSWLRQRTARW
jgi:hypothetical protein